MPIAAVPLYLGQDFREASPGMRFGMYLPIWTNRSDQENEVRQRAAKRSREGQEIADMLRNEGMDATILNLRRRERNPLPGLFEKNKFAARRAWEGVSALTQADQDRIKGLIVRQQHMARTCSNVLVLQATAVAPFTTGLGNEHPLENGFAFLWPYGVPYLPGSGVKGVLRRAAQELAQGLWEDDRGWRGLDQPCYCVTFGSGKREVTLKLSVLDVLFGREPPSGDSDAVRGALTFWDVIPQIEGKSLMVEIMTPHQSHYYQQKKEKKSGDSVWPHDSGQPNPICFLTVPPGSAFTFYVVCDRRHLDRLTRDKLDDAPDLLADDRWKKLAEAAFEHAFEWLGFGAKTAVGYGAMRRESPEQVSTNGAMCRREKGQEQVSTKSAGGGIDEEIWPSASLEFKPGTGEIIASIQGQKTAPCKGNFAQTILEQLQPEQRKRLEKKKKLSGISVRVRKQGNLIELLGLAK